MTHTPGPWIVNPFCAQIDCSSLDEDGDPIPVCQMLWPTTLRSEAETQATAHVIAAAPEMLEALEGLRRVNRKGITGQEAREAWRKANAAIAKARGEA